MEYFAIQVWTGKEDEFAKRVSSDQRMKSAAIVPKKAVQIRRKGKIRQEQKPLFPGYIFLVTDTAELEVLQRWVIRTTTYFVRILPNTREPLPVKEKDRRLLTHFMSFGKVADISKVSFDADQRIVVLEGPLKGLEGLIVKVDKRKGRAKIRLDMCENSFLVDLGFEVIDRSAKGPDDSDGKQA